ncbi:unnamed protein product, partial [Ectocarpus sp. 12 AP-2014]
HRASRGGRVTVAETLLQAGADANMPGDRGKTPLHEASRAGCARVVSLLVKHGANVNAEDRRGRTPLHYTTSDEVRRVLLDTGANPDARDNMGEKPHLTVGTSESSSRKFFGRISGPRRLLVDAFDAHSSRSIPRSSEDDVDKLYDAHRGGRERDLETSVVRRLKESLKRSERLATWLENHLAKHRSDPSCLKEYNSRRRRDGRREYRRPSEPTTALDTSSLSHSPSSCRSSVSDHTCVRRPRRRNSGRESPARAKVARCVKGSSKRASDEPGGRNKHVRNSRSKPSLANGGQANAKGTPQGFRPHFSDDKLGSLAAGDDKRWCTHGKLSGTDSSDHDTDEENYPGVSVVDRRHSATAGRGVRCPGNTSSRPRRRRPERRVRTRPQRNRSKRSVSIDEEAERIGAHRLVRSMSTAMMEMTAGSDSPGNPGGRRGRAVDETVSTSTEQPTPRQEYRRGTTVVARRRRELGEEENEQVRVGAARFNESHFPKSGTGGDGIGSSPHRGHLAKGTSRRRTTDETQSSSECLAHNLSDFRLDLGAASQRTPQRRGGRRLHHRGEDQRGTTGDGLTKAERLVAVKLFNFVSETIGTAVPRSPWKCGRREGTARDPVVGRDAWNGQDVDLTTAAASRRRDYKFHQDSVPGDDADDGGEGKGCEKGSVGNEAGGFVGGNIDDQEDVTGSLSKPKEEATAVAVKQNAAPTTSRAFTAPLVPGSPGANLAALPQEEGPSSHFQETAVCADYGKSESAIIAAKRTVADQVLEVAEQLSRMCVMPVD